MDENQLREQFQELLPFYLSGRLSDAERNWIEEFLDERPELATELQIESLLKSTLMADIPVLAADTGLQKFMSAIRNDWAKQVAISPPTRRKTGNGLRTWLGSILTESRWAVAMVLLILQTGLITLLLTDRLALMSPVQTQWRSPINSSTQKNPVLQITFKPSATEEEIRMLLVKIQGSLVGGPGQLGNYLVKVPTNKIEAAGQQVRASAIVESVQLLPELPAPSY